MTYSLLSRFIIATSMAMCVATAIAAEDASSRQTSATSPKNKPLSAKEIYAARQKGQKLYSEKKYDEAYPHLMTAAVRGFKWSQAQLGFMHLGGLGNVKKDTRLAIGWLGVAAEGITAPPIRRYFKDMWKQIPKKNRPAYQKLIDKFIGNYGVKVNNIKCRKLNKPGSNIREMRCMVTDENGRPMRDELEDMQRELAIGRGIEQVGFGVPGGGSGGAP